MPPVGNALVVCVQRTSMSTTSAQSAATLTAVRRDACASRRGVFYIIAARTSSTRTARLHAPRIFTSAASMTLARERGSASNPQASFMTRAVPSIKCVMTASSFRRNEKNCAVTQISASCQASMSERNV